MSILYVTDSDTKISAEDNRLIATYSDGTKHSLPIETVESVSFLTRAPITVSAMTECLKRGIPISFMTKGGRYFGRLISPEHINAPLQRKQSLLYNTKFALEFSKIIIAAKTKNQLIVLKRYAKSREIDISNLRERICILIAKIPTTNTLQELMGYEGQCAKFYFEGLSKCIESEFAFNGRSRRPPKDPFNSLISLGYSVLMNEIYNEIEAKGLNPYFGFLHQDAEKHPTLVSDLLEEWRAAVVDSIAMSLINGHELKTEHFYSLEGKEGCFLTKDGMKIFLRKFEKKLQTKVKYLSYVSYPVSFRRAIALQIGKLSEAIMEEDANRYEPLIIR